GIENANDGPRDANAEYGARRRPSFNESDGFWFRLRDGGRTATGQSPRSPSAQPSLRGSEPPVSVPLSQSIQIAWPPPSGPTTLVVLWTLFLRPSTLSDRTA